MKSEKESAWKYSPDERPGDSKFDGLPCPTKKVFQEIGIEGVTEIDEIIKEMIECKKKMYGIDSKLLNFFPHMAFFNTETKQTVACKEKIFNEDKQKELDRLYEFPERAIQGNYTLIFPREGLPLVEEE